MVANYTKYVNTELCSQDRKHNFSFCFISTVCSFFSPDSFFLQNLSAFSASSDNCPQRGEYWKYLHATFPLAGPIQLSHVKACQKSPFQKCVAYALAWSVQSAQDRSQLTQKPEMMGACSHKWQLTLRIWMPSDPEQSGASQL